MMPFIPQILMDLKLPDKWKGVAAEKWSALNFDPETLTQNPDIIFKAENDNITALKKIEFKGKKIPFVVKKTACRKGIRAIAEFLRAPKSLRNFYLAILLKQKNIEVAEPIVALWHKKHGSIFITEYIQNSLNLYEVAFGKDKEILTKFAARKSIIRQTAGIIAKLHKANFWHRDSKAGNFIIYKDGIIYRVKLIDLDGIKQNSKNPRVRQENIIRKLSKLAETLTRFKTVNMTDLYRGFLVYCDTMRIEYTEARMLFKKVERATVTLRLSTAIADSENFKEK